ncbi:hypothetical protein NEPAR07_1797 [Nematocida parisii]|uniref:Uncharacterized protein n=1 Tax=Nematocida parisii (strain ERTm3) TaxID=935791 RepID=I3EFS8_NEMP3|nr:hypothetical protein NEQG_01519 [Nematocida parisii ERTm3]KAI5145591.1 hypothetical protein NEPAR07_1797 [Nematocida parisii]
MYTVLLQGTADLKKHSLFFECIYTVGYHLNKAQTELFTWGDDVSVKDNIMSILISLVMGFGILIIITLAIPIIRKTASGCKSLFIMHNQKIQKKQNINEFVPIRTTKSKIFNAISVIYDTLIVVFLAIYLFAIVTVIISTIQHAYYNISFPVVPIIIAVTISVLILYLCASVLLMTGKIADIFSVDSDHSVIRPFLIFGMFCVSYFLIGIEIYTGYSKVSSYGISNLSNMRVLCLLFLSFWFIWFSISFVYFFILSALYGLVHTVNHIYDTFTDVKLLPLEEQLYDKVQNSNNPA